MAGIASIVSDGLDLQAKVSRIYLQPLDDQGQDFGRMFVFQWNPESIQVERDIGWSAGSVNGGSDPLRRWAAGGGRTFQFTVQFTQDEYKLPEDAGDRRKLWSPDITTARRWLENMTLPRYGASGSEMAKPPRHLRLTIPNGKYGDQGSDDVVVILESMGETLTTAWPDGTPRGYEIPLTFAESRQRGTYVSFRNADADFDTLDTALKKWPWKKL